MNETELETKSFQIHHGPILAPCTKVPIMEL